MRKIKCSVFCALLQFFLSDLAMGAGLVISEKETEVARNIIGHNVIFPALVIKHQDEGKETTVIHFSSEKKKSSPSFHDIYVSRNNYSISLTDNLNAELIVNRLRKLVSTGCNPLELKYLATWRCTSSGHTYYILNELYPADTDFKHLLTSVTPEFTGVTPENVSSFANQNHDIGELFSLVFKTKKVQDQFTKINFFYLGQNIYALIFDRSLIFLTKERLIDFIKNSGYYYFPKKVVLGLYESSAKPYFSSLSSWFFDLTERYYHFVKKHPYIFTLQAISFGTPWSILILMCQLRQTTGEHRSNNMVKGKGKGKANTDSKKKPVKRSNKPKPADECCVKKPEDHFSHFSHFNVQHGETIILPPPVSQHHVRELAEQEIRELAGRLQEAFRHGNTQAEQQVNLMRALQNIVDELSEAEVHFSLREIIEADPRVAKNVRKAVNARGRLDFADDEERMQALFKKLSRKLK